MNWDDAKFKLSYHVDRNGDKQSFCTLLSCYEQICYFELRKVSNFNPWVFFCDDINLCITNENNISLESTYIKEQFVEEKEWIIENNHFAEISKILKEHGEVMCCTAFNFIPDYCWCEEGREQLHLGHGAYLLDEDEKNYYIADAPEVFLGIEKIKMKNPSIVMIPKEHFAEAFKQYCEIWKIIIKSDISLQKERFFLEQNLRKIIEHYKESGEGTVMGKAALFYLIEKCRQKEDVIFKDFFCFHLIVSRRLILQRCLQIFLRETECYKEIILYLSKCIEKWRMIKDFSFDYLYYGQPVGMKGEPVLESIVEYEDKLIQSIKRALDTKI